MEKDPAPAGGFLTGNHIGKGGLSRIPALAGGFLRFAVVVGAKLPDAASGSIENALPIGRG